MIEFPSDDEIEAYANRNLGGNYVPLMRDLARMAALLHLKEEGFFDTETALAGGMALRCYGGNRLTMRDADTSTNLNRKAGELQRFLTFEIPHRLRVEAEPPGSWPRRSGLEIVKPIHFDPLFSQLALTPKAREFDLTISKRGLALDPRPMRFRHHYEWTLGTESIEFPLMDIREMIAEKALGFGVARVQKHYADLAVIGFLSTKRPDLQRDLSSSKPLIRTMVEDKLEVGRDHAADGEDFIKEAYARVPNYAALSNAFREPEQHLGLVDWDGAIQWIPTSWMNPISFRNAKAVVTGIVYPLLFDD